MKSLSAQLLETLTSADDTLRQMLYTGISDKDDAGNRTRHAI